MSESPNILYAIKYKDFYLQANNASRREADYSFVPLSQMATLKVYHPSSDIIESIADDFLLRIEDFYVVELQITKRRLP